MKASEPGSLHSLDEALFGVRQMVQHRWYRRRVLRGLSFDIELSTLRLLRAVQRNETPPTVGEMAESLAIAPSTASRLAERAAASGYVDRVTGTEDRRRIRLQLTDRGQEVLEQVNARRREILAEVTEGWDASDVERLTQFLTMLLRDFKRVEGSQ